MGFDRVGPYPARTVRTVQRPHLRTAVAAVAFVLAVGSTGCSGEQTAAEQFAELGITDTPAVAVAVAVSRPSPYMNLGSDLGAEFLRVRFATRGYSWADSSCAVDKALDEVGVAKFANMTAGEVQQLHVDVPAAEKAARTCASPESIARIDQPKAPDTGPAVDRVAPDLDAGEIRAFFTDMFEATTEAIGFTKDESACTVDTLLGSMSDDDVIGLVHGTTELKPADTADDIADCLGSKRLPVVAVTAGKSLIADKEKNKAAHDAKQEELNRQLDEINRELDSN